MSIEGIEFAELEDKFNRLKDQVRRWQDVACDLYNAAQDDDYKVMVKAMIAYEKMTEEQEIV